MKVPRSIRSSVDKLEFLVGMLTKLEILNAEKDVFPFLRLFDEMDADGPGRLDRDDLAAMVRKQEAENRQLQEYSSLPEGQARRRLERSTLRLIGPAAFGSDPEALAGWKRLM